MVTKNDSRIKWLDFVRALAILCVVLCHSVEGIYSTNIEGGTIAFDLEGMLSKSLLSQVFAFSSFTLGRLGVPLFLLITGYLLLDREYDSVRIKTFWKKRWLHLLICTVLWFFIYDIFICVYYHSPFDFLTMVEDLLFIHKVNMAHVWYMPMILGIYLLIPLVSKALKSIDIRLIFFPIAIYTAYAFLYPVLNVVNNVYNPDSPLSIQFSLGFSGGAYGLYLLFGYLVKKDVFKRIKTSIFITIFLASFFVAVFLQLWSYEHNNSYNIWYDNLFLLVAAVSFFELVSRIKSNWGRAYRVIRIFSYYSFAIYITHNIFLTILLPYMRALPYMLPMKVALILLCSVVTGLVFSVALSKIPKIGKYILYLK